jgi:hypothetical protein
MVLWDTLMLSLSAYGILSRPEICSGDQSNISLLATMFRNFRLTTRRHLGPQDRIPGLVIRFMGSIGRTAAVACDLPAHRRGGSIENTDMPD